VPARGVVNLDDVTTIPKTWLQQRVSALSAARLDEIEAAIRFALDLS
jgi:mRNA-degrading endonuclease toxin of MazEF toxin-antitoxin module